MTTHLRGRVWQAGALLAVVVGGIAVTPAVALAAGPTVTITSLVPGEVQSGGSVTMKYTVKGDPTGPADTKVSTKITVSGQDSCDGSGCDPVIQLGPGEEESFEATLTMPKVDAGTTRRQVTITVVAKPEGQSSGSASQSVTVRGAAKPQTVTSVSGKVKDQDGKAISGVQVALKDTGGHVYAATTNGSGGYSFNSTDTNQISPGAITVGVIKSGFESTTVTVQAEAGKSVTVPVTMKAAATTPSASPSATASAGPSSQSSPQPVEEASGPVQLDTGSSDTQKASDDSGSGSWLFIVLGGLLVAAGIGAIVLVMMRRKNATSEDEGDDPTSIGSGSGGVVPPSQGRFNDATRVAAPVVAGGAATMVAPAARPGVGSLADAPTMVQQVEDEFPDPYGAPLPQQGGYQAQGAGGWDNQGGDGYGNAYAEPTQYGQPPQDNGYGAGTYGAAGYPGDANGYAVDQGGGYGDQQQRYDEPTGMYNPEAAGHDGYGYDQGGYDQAQGNQYGGYADQGGYDQAGGYSGQDDQGYGSWGPQGGDENNNAYAGPQAGNGYGPAAGAAAPVAGGTYGVPQQPQQPQYGTPQQQYGTPQGGYDQGGGYGGYDQQGQGGGTYGGQQGGYEQPGGGYDPQGQGGYGSGYDQGQNGGQQQQQPNRQGGQFRPQEPSHPGQRRSLDWMDN